MCKGEATGGYRVTRRNHGCLTEERVTAPVKLSWRLPKSVNRQPAIVSGAA
jgi:hypothetical protein